MNADGSSEPAGVTRSNPLAARGWPLLIVLIIQAGLSARLIWSKGAFQDEAMYLWAGHIELSHLFHNLAIPTYASFFSGSPVIYPILGASVDAVAGLIGARLLSLAFMLASTALLHGTTRRLLASREAATFAAALFGWMAASQFLGAYATFDAMALMLLALSTWLGVRAADCHGADQAGLLTATAVALVAADATKYAAALFNPVVIAIVICAAWQAGRRIAGALAGAWITLATGGLIAGAYTLGGAPYAAGVAHTTVERSFGEIPAAFIWTESVRWAGVVVGLAVVAAIIVTFRRTGWVAKLTAWTLAGAGFLAPAEQARIHTITSLFKHLGYGAWFSAAIAGSLLAGLPQVIHSVRRSGGSRRRHGGWPLAVGAITAATAAVIATAVVGYHYPGWPSEHRLVAVMRMFEQPQGKYLVEDPPVPAYYLMSSSHWYQWYSTQSLNYTDPNTGAQLTGAVAYADAIQNRYFTVIVLWFGDTLTTDKAIVADIKLYRTYRLAGTLPFRTVHGTISHYLFWVPRALNVMPLDHPVSGSCPRWAGQGGRVSPCRQPTDHALTLAWRVAVPR